MYQFISPIKIYYGKEALNNLDKILLDLKIQHVFLLTDPILKSIGVITPILERLSKLNIKVEISIDTEPEPSLRVGNVILEKVRESEAEIVIGIGGGSTLDLAKAASVIADNEGVIEDYLNLTGESTLISKGLPKILIPTTAGTGSEVTDIAVFSLEDTKDVIAHDFLLADYTIIDPVLTYTLPSKETAASGIDALTHAIEAYTSVNATPLTDTLALDAIRRIMKHIRTAVWNGGNKEAREQMALGSMLAGMSFYNAGVAGVHGLAYPLGGLFKIPHGESNAVLLSYVYDYIWPSCLAKVTDIAEAFQLPIDGKTNNEIAILVVKSLIDLVKDVGLPTTIKEYKINEEDIDRLTTNALKQTRLLQRSPKLLDSRAIKEIYSNAYEGKLTNHK